MYKLNYDDHHHHDHGKGEWLFCVCWYFQVLFYYHTVPAAYLSLLLFPGAVLLPHCPSCLFIITVISRCCSTTTLSQLLIYHYCYFQVLFYYHTVPAAYLSLLLFPGAVLLPHCPSCLFIITVISRCCSTTTLSQLLIYHYCYFQVLFYYHTVPAAYLSLLLFPGAVLLPHCPSCLSIITSPLEDSQSALHYTPPSYKASCMKWRHINIMAPQCTSSPTVCTTAWSGWRQGKYQSFALLAFF